MTTKKRYLLSLITVSICVSMLLASCTKEDFKERVTDTTNTLITNTYRGVSLQHDEVIGDYLSFRSENIVDSIMTELERNYDDVEFQRWEEGIGFYSLRQRQNDVGLAPNDWYPDDVFATFLNPKGYIMIDGVLYQDTEDGDLVYKIEDGQKSIHYNGISEMKNGCNNDDDNGYAYHECAYNIPDFRVYGKIDYYGGWALAKPKVFLITSLKHQKCSGSGGWKNAKGTITINWSFDVTINGSPYSTNNSSYTKYNKSYFKYPIVSGKNLCINELSSTHTGAWQNANESVNLYVGD